MNILRKLFLLSLVISIMGLSTHRIIAQPPAGTPPSNPPSGVTGQPCWDQECVPIDSGIFFLIIGGILVGIRSIHGYRKMKNSKQ